MDNLPLDSIVCGDNVTVMQSFPDACIDLVVTSPPYDNLRTYGGHSWDFEGVAQQLWRIIKPGGVVVWVVADATINGSETGTSFRQALRFMELGFRLHDTMIWNKEQFTDTGGGVRYPQTTEWMFVLTVGQPTTFNPIRDRRNKHAGTRLHGTIKVGDTGRTRSISREVASGNRVAIIGEYGIRFNSWVIYPDKTSSHPAPFPEALAADHIRSWSNEGDIVLDPFSGSGTTAKMARELGRRYIGIEVNPDYVEIANRRLDQQLLPFA